MKSDRFSEKPLSSKPHCPFCDAELYSTKVLKCWLCHQQLSTAKTGDAEAAGKMRDIRLHPRELVRDEGPWTVFGVLSLLMIVGMSMAAPGFLVVLLILAVPAVIRATIRTAQVVPAENEFPAAPFVRLFVSSIGIVVMIGLAAFISFGVAFFVVCMGGMAVVNFGSGGERVLQFSVMVGATIGLVVAGLLFARSLRRKE